MNSHFHAQDAMRRLIKAAVGVSPSNPKDPNSLESADSPRMTASCLELAADHHTPAGRSSNGAKLL